MTWEYWRLWLVDRTGWTVEYVDSLELSEAWGMIDIWQSADKAHAQNQRKASRAARKGR